ncbi:MAG: hypothetical protein Q9218_008164 [Villophora microphyllina]
MRAEGLPRYEYITSLHNGRVPDGHEDFNAGIGAAEMLGRANYVALVGGGRNPKFPTNKVIIWDDAKQLAVVTLEFHSQVFRALLSRSQILVALLNSVSLYAFSSPPKKVSSFETADNPSGLCCLGSKIVAFPGRTPGQVQIVEIGTGNPAKQEPSSGSSPPRTAPASPSSEEASIPPTSSPLPSPPPPPS